MTTVTIREARKLFTELINQVYYGKQQIRIARRSKVMVRLVSEEFMQRLDELLKNDEVLREKLTGTK
jgi:prevent-host-death family protein